MSLVAFMIARWKATRVPPAPACLTASGIFSYSLSSPTQRILPSPHWASKSSLKFRSAIGGYCIVSLPFRQLPAADQNQEGKDRICRDERDGEKRRCEVESNECEKANEILRGGKDEEARRFLVRLNVCLTVRRRKRYRIRHRHYDNGPQRVIRGQPQDDAEECSRKAKPVKGRYFPMAFDYRQNGDAEHRDRAHTRDPRAWSCARKNLREKSNPHQECEGKPRKGMRLGRAAEDVAIVRYVADKPHNDGQNAENDSVVVHHTFNCWRRSRTTTTTTALERTISAGNSAVVHVSDESATIESENRTRSRDHILSDSSSGSRSR